MKMRFIYFLMFPLAASISMMSCNDDDAPKTMPVVTTTTPANVTTTSATVGGSITDNGNDAITASGVIYSNNIAMPTTSDNKLEIDLASGLSIGSFTGLLENLSSGKIYHIRAFATNGVGTAYGSVVDFMTGNGPPVITNLTAKGTFEVGKTLTADYTYKDPENDVEGASAYQWYIATSSTGTGEATIEGATSKTFVVQDAQNNKFIRVSVTPKAAAGTALGTEVKSSYTTAIGAETVTFDYNGSPVTYGTIISTTTQKKWLDRNLGATRLAQSVDDYLAYGDLFQWGRKVDGHQHILRTSGADADASGSTGITSTIANELSSGDTPTTDKFIIAKGAATPRDWRSPQNNNLWQGVNGANNPCPVGWGIPTRSEWAAETFTNNDDAFAKLKISNTGQRSRVDGTVTDSNIGFYWNTESFEYNTGMFGSLYVSVTATMFYVPTAESGDFATRATGMACRCIKD